MKFVQDGNISLLVKVESNSDIWLVHESSVVVVLSKMNHGNPTIRNGYHHFMAEYLERCTVYHHFGWYQNPLKLHYGARRCLDDYVAGVKQSFMALLNCSSIAAAKALNSSGRLVRTFIKLWNPVTQQSLQTLLALLHLPGLINPAWHTHRDDRGGRFTTCWSLIQTHSSESVASLKRQLYNVNYNSIDACRYKLHIHLQN